jgi:phosphoglycolate phosphatase
MTILSIQGQQYEIQGILFDKDGTLLEFMNLWGRWAELMTEQVMNEISYLGGQPSAWLRTKLLGIEADETGSITGYDRQGPLSMGSIPEIEALMAWQLYQCGMPWNESITRIREFRSKASLDMEHERPAVPMPGLLDFLEQCTQLKLSLCVVTADDTADAKKHLTWMDAAHYFQHIIGNDQVLEGKPSPEMVRIACHRAGLWPSQIALIGDTNGDMQMGKAAGVAVTIGFSKDPLKNGLNQADHIISDYKELTVRLISTTHR